MYYGYCALRPSGRDARVVEAVMQSIGLNGIVPADELHMTLMYDKSNPLSESSVRNIVKSDKKYFAVPVDVLILGGDSLVIEFECKSIEDRHQELSMFMTHSYDDFIPHMSVKYDASETDLALLNAFKEAIFSTIPLLTFSEEYFEAVKKENDQDVYDEEET